MDIRKLSIKDCTQIAEVYCEEENIIITELYLDKLKNAFTKIIDKGDFVLGAFKEDILAGCISVHLMYDTYPGYTDGPYAHIETMIIKKEYRNIGVGSELLRKAVEELSSQNVTYIIIQTGEYNIAARRSIEKAGFGLENVNYIIKFDNNIQNALTTG